MKTGDSPSASLLFLISEGVGWLFSMAVVGAGVLFLARAAIYLVTGKWIHTICQTISLIDLENGRYCAIDTPMIGANHIYAYIVGGLDASLAALIVAATLFGMALALMMAGAIANRVADRSH